MTFNRRFLFFIEANNVVKPYIWGNFVRNFGFNKGILINKSGEPIPPNPEFYDIYPEMINVLQGGQDENGVYYRDYTHVYLKPPESIPGNPNYKGFSKDKFEFEWLSNFEHPTDNTLYIFGPDQFELPIDFMDLSGNNKLLAIEIEKNSLWSIIAGSIVANDAFSKDR